MPTSHCMQVLKWLGRELIHPKRRYLEVKEHFSIASHWKCPLRISIHVSSRLYLGKEPYFIMANCTESFKGIEKDENERLPSATERMSSMSITEAVLVWGPGWESSYVTFSYVSFS